MLALLLWYSQQSCGRGCVIHIASEREGALPKLPNRSYHRSQGCLAWRTAQAPWFVCSCGFPWQREKVVLRAGARSREVYLLSEEELFNWTICPWNALPVRWWASCPGRYWSKDWATSWEDFIELISMLSTVSPQQCFLVAGLGHLKDLIGSVPICEGSWVWYSPFLAISSAMRWK